jgi:hypothetical protein
VTITKNIGHNCAFLFQSNVLNNNRTGRTTHCVHSDMLDPFRSVASKHQHKHDLPVFRSCLLSYSLRRNQRVLGINFFFEKLSPFLTEISSHDKKDKMINDKNCFWDVFLFTLSYALLLRLKSRLVQINRVYPLLDFEWYYTMRWQGMESIASISPQMIVSLSTLYS